MLVLKVCTLCLDPYLSCAFYIPNTCFYRHNLFREKVLFTSDFNKINIDFHNLVKSLKEGSLAKSACIPLISALWRHPELQSETCLQKTQVQFPAPYWLPHYCLPLSYSASDASMGAHKCTYTRGGERGRWTIKLKKQSYSSFYIL